VFNITRVTKEKKNLFFSRDIYILNTSPQGWSVRRRLSDFRWLSVRLRSEFPSNNVAAPSHLQIIIFKGKNQEEIESYMNYLLTEEQILESKFFLFFISCSNLVKFYTKKDKEYNPKAWEKWISSNNQLPMRKSSAKEPSTASAIIDPKSSIMPSKEEITQIGEQTKVHQFLEASSPVVLTHGRVMERLFKVIEELKANLKQASANLKELGELFSNLGEGYAEIEKSDRPELAKVKPSLSHLYINLKKSIFQMSNTLEQKHNIFKRFFERNLTEISENLINVVKMISIRDESVKRLTMNIEMSKDPAIRSKNSELVQSVLF